MSETSNHLEAVSSGILEIPVFCEEDPTTLELDIEFDTTQLSSASSVSASVDDGTSQSTSLPSGQSAWTETTIGIPNDVAAGRQMIKLTFADSVRVKDAKIANQATTKCFFASLQQGNFSTSSFLNSAVI